VLRILEMTLTDAVRSQDGPYLVRRVLWNREHAATAWLFVMDNWDALNARFPSNSISRMLEGVRGLAIPQIAPSVFTFFETHEVPQGDKILAQHLERLGVNVALRDREIERFTHSLT
jgi:puromycin-sensitive aminopeptidase